MIRLTVNQLANKLAIKEIASIANEKIATRETRNVEHRVLTKLAQEIEAGIRKAWVRESGEAGCKKAI